jgi:hypothetical protein
MKKFLSNSLSGVGLGDGLAEGEAATVGAADVVVVAGDMVVVAGDIPGTAVAPVTGGTAGVMAGAGAFAGAVAGLVAVVGGGPGGLLAGAGGGVWPNEVSTRVTEKRLAISNVFIG